MITQTLAGTTDPTLPNLPVRKCNCSGSCAPQNNLLSRRDFLGIVGVGTAAMALGDSAWADFELPADQFAAWQQALMAPAKPRVYFSDQHTDARMHLGGIGTGNFEIGADGQFTTWQLFNTLRDGHVPLHFAVKTGAGAKLLQVAGGPDWPRVQRIEMSGEYPFTTLRFHDPNLPVELELTAFSPFAPLDTRLSSMPVAAFVFKVHNPSNQPQTVSLAAFMQNPVGYDAAGNNTEARNPAFGSNINEVLREGAATGLLMRAAASPEPTLDQPVSILTLANLAPLLSPPPDRPANLKLDILGSQPIEPAKLLDPSHTVIWLEEPPANLSAPFLRTAREAVNAGATLVFSGKAMPLLEAFASWTGGKPVADAAPRPDMLFEDFERGYEQWTVEGDAFGKEPARGTLANQQPVSGFVGKGLVNTFLNGDDTTGRLISKPFSIERRFVRFLVGGGHHELTQIRLVIDGKTVRATAGRDNERLESAVWDVGEFSGKTARIEIVDLQKGPWGHINVDQIEFSDLAGERATMLILEELLPVRFSAIRVIEGRNPDDKSLEFEDLTLQPGASQTKSKDGASAWVKPMGIGKVALVAAAVLDPAHAGISNYRQRAYASLCGWVGANYLVSNGQHPKAPGFGTLALATLGPNPSLYPTFETWPQAWKQFVSDAAFSPPPAAQANPPSPNGRTILGAVQTSTTIPAGGTQEIPFLLTWHYPNKYNASGTAWIGCHYATQWADARAVVRDVAERFTSLREQTELFRQTFYNSTLPWWLLDCITANVAILRHIGIVFRIANGDVYGWEGSNGCCDPTCTHVWGYEQTLSRLFPSLEREMRRIDFKHQQREDGGVNNRTEVPSPPRPTGEQPFADGHASCILKAYREALNSPNDAFFREYWPHIQRGVDYLIARDAKAAGGEPAGILQDDQWNTYDEALHGVTTFISGYYLVALRAGEEWARRMGDGPTADRFHAIFLKGQKQLVDLCWNGEYFAQHLPDYAQRQGEVGPGCMSDQLIGQWWAHQLGLGYILPQEKVVAALRAVFKHNFKSDLTGWKHAPRAFAGQKDKGLLICTWPKGGRPPGVMLYSDEVWTGIEYQVAAHMLYEGLTPEGFAIVKAARDRYDGIPRPPIQRNPWNEIECGGHYARAMSSWSLLLALSGWEYDGPRQDLRLTPRYSPDDFGSFFAGPEGWGAIRQSRKDQTQSNTLTVVEGRLPLATLALAAVAKPMTVRARLAGNPVKIQSEFISGSLRLSFDPPLTVQKGQTLEVQLSLKTLGPAAPVSSEKEAQ